MTLLLLREERVKAACASITTRSPVRVLGQGGEGIVFTDENTIWKLFDRWSPEQAARALPILRQLIEHGSPGNVLIQPLAIVKTSQGWLLSQPFEETVPWSGGQGPGLIELIVDLHRSGLAFRNFHPKNLRVTNGTVRLIDYGADFRCVNDPQAEGLEFVCMCRRVWLCWRWWWRKDIDLLMRRSLHEADLPELDGHEYLIRAVRERLELEKS